MGETRQALAPEHLAMLKASMIADEVIAARGYYTATTKTALEALGFGRSQRLLGLVIPVYNVHGDLATYLLRPDAPRIPYGKTKPAKYEFMYGMHMTLDVPRVEVVWKALGNPQIPLWITEGSKKVDSLASAGCCAVAVLGVWNWRGTNDQGGKTALPDWNTIALNGRTVYIVYDSDVMLKDEVHQALARIGAYLGSRKAHVRYLYLPAGPSGAKVGIDDYFAQGHTLDDAMRHASTTLHATPGQAAPLEEHWKLGLQSTKNGVPLQTMHNIGVILDQHPYWQEPEHRLWFDDVQGMYHCGEEELSEADITYAGEWFGRVTGMLVTHERLIKRAVNARCMRAHRDLLCEELSTLPAWDGVERLGYWLGDHAGVARTAYTMTVARLLPVSMVARAYTPGCQYRYVIVLVGEENTGKSKLLRHLGGEQWFGEFSCSLEGKEAHMMIRGIWLAELAELESLGRTGENRLKSYLTMEHDLYIPKFENYKTKVPRRTIFVGTTNEHEFLKGQTGNTRYLPVQCGEIDPEGFMPIRDQLLAEAIVYWRAHPHDWWQLGAEADRQAQEEREARREKSVYEDLLASTLLEYAHIEHIEGELTTYMVWWDLIAEKLNIEPAQRTKRIQYDVGMALRALGWTYSPHRESVTFHGKSLQIRPWRSTGSRPRAP